MPPKVYLVGDDLSDWNPQISQKTLLIHDLIFLFLTKVASNTVSHFSDRKGCALNHNYIFLLNFLTGWLTDSCYFIEKASLLKNESFPKAGRKLSCIYLIKQNNENQFHKVQVLQNHVVFEIFLLRLSFFYFTWDDAKNYYCCIMNMDGYKLIGNVMKL